MNAEMSVTEEHSDPTVGARQPAVAGAPTSARAGHRPGHGLQRALTRYGLLVAFLIVIAVFGALKPSIFLTVENLKSVITIAAPLVILSVGLTVVLVMGDFDLSLGAMTGLGGAVAVVLMTEGTYFVFAIVVALLLAIAVGLTNGILVAYLRGSSFIITLALTNVLIGVELLFTDGKSITTGFERGYLNIAQTTPLFGLNTQVYVAAVLALIVGLLLGKTEIGRYMYAVGNSPEAARLAGLRTRQLRTIGFIVVALSATVAGILLTSQAGGSTPQQGASYLLPAFAGAFLGSAVFKPGQFNVAGTVVGVLFLGTVQTGLTIMDFSTAVVNIVQGAILVAAILLSQFDRRNRR
ncbi:MAG TPA: ABC transporter permease [Solirubrobacterales bacterium]|nr:ABC transporter permease [Solirubrobacterales bacterium]